MLKKSILFILFMLKNHGFLNITSIKRRTFSYAIKAQNTVKGNLRKPKNVVQYSQKCGLVLWKRQGKLNQSQDSRNNRALVPLSILRMVHPASFAMGAFEFS